jgi:phosphohistidine phosphatase SixA
MSQPSTTSRRSFLGLLSASVLAGPVLAQDDPALRSALRSATVVFVRHCEMEGPAASDPGLSETGRLRAAGIAELVQACAVTHVFATELRRTRESMEPVAKQSGLAVTEYGARDPAGLVTKLQALEGGEFVVVAAHANTLPKMVGLLGGSLDGLDQWGFLREREHDRVIIQTLVAAGESVSMRAVQTLDLRVGVGE